MIKKISLTTIYVALLSFVLSNPTFAAANPGPKIEQGLQQVQTFLTGLMNGISWCGCWGSACLVGSMGIQPFPINTTKATF